MAETMGIKACEKTRPCCEVQHRANDGRIAGDIPPGADQGFDHAGALHLMVVLAAHPLLGTDVGPPQHIQNQGLAIFRNAQHRLGQAAQGRRSPDGLELPLGKGRCEQIQIDIGTGGPVVGDMKFPGIGVGADHAAFDGMLPGQRHETIQMRGIDGHGHALLGFGDPDLPLVQAVVFQGHFFQLDVAAVGKKRTLADGRGEPAAAVVGDKADQPFVTGLQQKIVHLLLGVRIADLDVAGRRVFGKGGRRGRHAVNAVLAHPTAQHDGQVAGQNGLLIRWFAVDRSRHDTQRRHENQAFSQVSRMKHHLSEGGGNTAFIAAVAHPFDHTVQQAPGVQPRFEISLRNHAAQRSSRSCP